MPSLGVISFGAVVCALAAVMAGPAEGTTPAARVTLTGPVHGTFEGGCQVSGRTLVLGRFLVPLNAESSAGFTVTINPLKRNAGTHANLATTKNFQLLLEYALPSADWGSGWKPSANGVPGTHQGSGTLTLAKNESSGALTTKMTLAARNPRGYRTPEHVHATWTGC